MNRLISFGSSPIMALNKTIVPYPQIIANRLGIAYDSQAKPRTSNNKIARKILSYKEYRDDIVLVSWATTMRTEFRSEHGWVATDMTTYVPGSGFDEHWYAGPGRWEYTGVSTALKEILIAQSFLQSHNIPYIFTFDTNEIVHSQLYQHPDEYLDAIIKTIDHSRIILFENQGFIAWAESKGYARQQGNHFETQAHERAADIINAHLGPSGSESFWPRQKPPTRS
jgi:hypothetical protein